MLVAAARALAELAREDVVEEVERAYGKERFTFGPEYLLPKPIDPRILVRESAAVARQAIERLRLGLSGAQIVDPARSPRLETYVDEYFRIRRRRGVMRAAAAQRVLQTDTFAALMLLNVDPDAEDLAEIALLTASTARALGIEPRVSMLSFSNFGSVDHPHARKVRRATELAKEKAPGLVIDGEMQLMTALDGPLRREYFPFCSLDADANVLVFPDLQSGNLAFHLLQCVGGAVPVGPLLMGTRLPAHLLQYGATVEEVVNLVAVGAVEAASLKRTE